MKKYLLLAVFLFLPNLSHAAIAFDAATDGGFSSNSVSPSLTFSHTTTGTNLTLLVFCTTGNVVSQDDAITGITYNGVAMTRVNFSPFVASVGPFYNYYLKGPATGANNVVVTGATEANAYRLFCSSASYTGTDQSNYDAQTTNSALATATFNTSLVSIADNSWHIIGVGTSLTAPAAGTATTLRLNASNSFVFVFDSNSAKTPPGSVTLQETAAAENWNASMITLRPPQPITFIARLIQPLVIWW